MRRELFANDGQTALAGSILSTDTTITVDNGSVFPATGDFRILIGSEILLVTARSTNTLTVVRGQEGTTAAAHSNADGVAQSLTVGALKQYGRDNSPGFDGSRPPFRLLDANGNTLTSSDFTVVNASTATITDQDGSIILRKASVSGQDFTLLARAQPTPPSTLIIGMRVCWPIGVSGARVMAAIGLRESATGKLVLCSLERTTAGALGFSIYGYSSPTAEGATRLNPQVSVVLGPELFLKISDDATNVTFSVSDDGVTWISLYSQSRVTDFTTAPDQWVWGASSNSSSFNTISRLIQWSE